jgi:hypothetical protein
MFCKEQLTRTGRLLRLGENGCRHQEAADSFD